MWLCCWLVDLGPPSTVFPLIHARLWFLGVHGFLEDNPSKPKSSENKKNSCKIKKRKKRKGNYVLMHSCDSFSHFSVCCCCMMYYWRIFMNMNGVTVSQCFVCKQIYCSNGMFYQRKYEKCKKFAPCIKTNYEKKNTLLHILIYITPV